MGWYTLENSSNASCIMITGGISIYLSPLKNTTDYAYARVPRDGVNVSGSCSQGILTLTWNATAEKTNHISFYFSKNSTHWTWDKANGSIWSKLDNIMKFETPPIFTPLSNETLGHSHCAWCGKYGPCDGWDISVGTSETTGLLDLSNIRMEAFRNSTPGNKRFGYSDNCNDPEPASGGKWKWGLGWVIALGCIVSLVAIGIAGYFLLSLWKQRSLRFGLLDEES